MGLCNEIKSVGSMAARWPLETISNPASLVAKVVAAIAIAIFTASTLGYYAYYSYNYFAERKLEAQFLQLEPAVQANDVDRVAELFRLTPKLKETLNGFQGRSPSLLHLAVEVGHTQMIDLLLANGADVYGVSRMGTPLEVAVARGLPDMVRFLLDKKIDPNQEVMASTIYTTCANIRGPMKVEIVNLLLKAGVKVPDDNGLWSPLVSVAIHWDTHQELVRETLLLLIRGGARLRPEELKHPAARQFILDNTPR